MPKSRLACSRTLLTLASATLLHSVPARAVAVHGVVTNPLNRPVANALVALMENGKVVVSARTAGDGSYMLSTGTAGRFYVLATGVHFRQLVTSSFYSAALGSVERNVTLEPDVVRQAVVVSATGTPLPAAQVSAPVTELDRAEIENLEGVTPALRTVPGFTLSTTGERGGVTSLFVRGGNSDDNKILLDGMPIEDIGGTFDFADVSTTGVASIEAERGPDSVVYGTDAGAGVVDFSTPRGSTPFPSFFYQGDGGNFGTYRNEVQAGGTHNALDYYGAFGDFQTTNSVPNDTHHDVTSAANLGYALSTGTHLRVTARNSDSAEGSPGQYAFTRVSADAKQGDQNTYLTAALDHTFSDRWYAQAEYGLARKREEYQQFGPNGIYDPSTGNSLGQTVTVTGANGYSVTGQAITSYAGYGNYLDDIASNRDSLHAQTSYAFTPHLLAVAGFWYQDERGLYSAQSLQRTDFDYTLAFQGDFANRFFYTAAGGVEKNGLYGTVGAPHLGASYYAVRPGQGLFHGTRINFNFSKGYKEPTQGQQFGSLLSILEANGGTPLVNQYQVQPIGAAFTRSYDGGIEQSLANQRVLFKATYFHNEFENQIESVGPGAVPQLFPSLNAAQQATLENYISFYGADLNSLAFRAQGVETEVDYSPKANLYLLGGWTYLDAVVQHSFSSDALAPSYNTSSDFGTIPIGDYSPLVGARPFRRPPHTGFVSATYTGGKWTGTLLGAFASRADDSTALGGSDANYGNSLLLPNRDLDAAYASLHVGGTYQIKTRVGIYTELDNLTSSQHISPIGYLSAPFTARAGVRLTLGHEK